MRLKLTPNSFARALLGLQKLSMRRRAASSGVLRKQSMRFRPQYYVAGGIIGAFALYFLVSGLAGTFGAKKAQAAPPKTDVPMVQASLIEPQVRPYGVVVRGRTVPFRLVS